MCPHYMIEHLGKGWETQWLKAFKEISVQLLTITKLAAETLRAA